DHTIEVTGRSNPRIHLQPILLSTGVKVFRAPEWHDSSTDNLDSVRVRSQCDLPISPDHPARQILVLRLCSNAGAGQSANVVDSFQNYQMAQAGADQAIAMEARERIRPHPILEGAITADTRVENGKCPGGRRALQAPSQNVGPAVVAVRGCTVSVRD